MNEPDTNKQLVQFDFGELQVITKNGSEVTIRKEAVDFINRWIEFEKRFNEAKEILKKNILAEMEKTNTIKIESEDVKLMRRFFGERYEVVDPVEAKDFIIEEVKYKLDTKLIDEYVKNNGEIPVGIKLKDRAMSLVISSSSSKDDE